MFKNFLLSALLILSSIFLLPGCEIIGGIFKAGVWVGIIIVVIIIAIIFWIMNKFKK